MIDEYFERLIDRWCERIPAAMKPRMILLSHSPVGWRMQLYFGTLGRNIAGLFSRVSTDEKMDLVMRESSEHIDDGMEKLARWFGEQVLLFARLDARGRSLRFCGALFLMLLAALGMVARGAAMGAMAAALCLLWLSCAMDSDYRPVSAGVRQQYLAATMLRAGAFAVMLMHNFFHYAAQGVPSNIVLQCAMIVMLTVHAVLYVSMVMLNTRQLLFLRALAGVTGAVPALTAASAVALAASSLFRPWPLPLSGVLGALGAIFAFMGDALITVYNLGGIRLKYHSIWVCLLITGGFALMLLGAWTYTP